MPDSNWYVYRHIRLDKNEPFYIGIGQKKYFARAYNIKQRNKIWKDIFIKTDIDIEIVFENLSKEKAVEKEIEFIKLYGRIDLGTGLLANMTDGGEGSLNIIVNESYKKKLSLKISGSGNYFYGKRLTKEQEEKRLKSYRIWLASTNQRISPQAKDKHIKRMTGNKYATHSFVILKDSLKIEFNSAKECYRYLKTSKATFGYYLSGYRLKNGVKETTKYKSHIFNGYKIELLP